MTSHHTGTGKKKPRYTPQPLFQDGSDLSLFTGYNPQPEPKNAAPRMGSMAWNRQQPPVANMRTSLPVYHLTRVVEFYPNSPDQWGVLTGEQVALCSGTLVSILGVNPFDAEHYLVECEGRFAWTHWVAAV